MACEVVGRRRPRAGRFRFGVEERERHLEAGGSWARGRRAHQLICGRGRRVLLCRENCLLGERRSAAPAADGAFCLRTGVQRVDGQPKRRRVDLAALLLRGGWGWEEPLLAAVPLKSLWEGGGGMTRKTCARDGRGLPTWTCTFCQLWHVRLHQRAGRRACPNRWTLD